MTAVAYTAGWWPIVGLLLALTIWFACALCTASKSPAPRALSSVARGGTLRTRSSSTAGMGVLPRSAPTARGRTSLRAVGDTAPRSRPASARPSDPIPAWPASRGRK